MLKLVNFKHIDAAYLDANFMALACNEGSIGLAHDLTRRAIIDAIVDPTIRAAWLQTFKDDGSEANDLFLEREDELQDLILHLPMMFNVGLTAFHWCFHCKNASPILECGCPERRGITNIDWDQLDSTYVSPVYVYTIHIQSLKTIVVKSYCGAFDSSAIIADIVIRYNASSNDKRFSFLFDTLRRFGIPRRGETVAFKYERRTVGHISCS